MSGTLVIAVLQLICALGRMLLCASGFCPATARRCIRRLGSWTRRPDDLAAGIYTVETLVCGAGLVGVDIPISISVRFLYHGRYSGIS